MSCRTHARVFGVVSLVVSLSSDVYGARVRLEVDDGDENGIGPPGAETERGWGWGAGGRRVRGAQRIYHVQSDAARATADRRSPLLRHPLPAGRADRPALWGVSRRGA